MKASVKSEVKSFLKLFFMSAPFLKDNLKLGADAMIV